MVKTVKEKKIKEKKSPWLSPSDLPVAETEEPVLLSKEFELTEILPRN